MGMATSNACPACGASMRVFHEQADVPVHSCLLLESSEQARVFPTGQLRLGFCEACGFISNLDFDASRLDYSAGYEETQAFSPRFQQFAADLAGRWVRRHHLEGKSVLEIGCGKGDFLLKMVAAGAASGTGIDPAVAPERYEDDDVTRRVTWIPELYSADYLHLQADAVVCRHTLEHIHPVRDFLRLVRAGIGEREHVSVLFELPDTLRVLREAAFWDVYYEHCSYFTPGSLARLFRDNGFDVLDVALDYDDQYILLEARPARGPRGRELPASLDDIAETAAAVEHFARSYAAMVEGWKRELADVQTSGGRSVIWGAGSKGVAFLNAVAGAGGIEYAVDINPHKHDMYMAGTGQRIVSPQFLREYRPSTVVAMNPIYCEEIGRDLRALGVDARLLAL